MKRNLYYWVFGRFEGKPLLLGPYNTEDEAHEVGMLKIEGDYEVILLPTRDEARATRMLKARRLKDESLREAIEKVRHGKGVDRVRTDELDTEPPEL